nr:MFS transporter [Komagataeibacter kakiaceti]
MYYAPKILEGAHFGTSAAAWATVLVGVINAVIGVVAVYMVSRWGRRPLLAASCIIMAGALAVAAVIEGMHLQGLGATSSLWWRCWCSWRGSASARGRWSGRCVRKYSRSRAVILALPAPRWPTGAWTGG